MASPISKCYNIKEASSMSLTRFRGKCSNNIIDRKCCFPRILKFHPNSDLLTLLTCCSQRGLKGKKVFFILFYYRSDCLKSMLFWVFRDGIGKVWPGWVKETLERCWFSVLTCFFTNCAKCEYSYPYWFFFVFSTLWIVMPEKS